MMLSVRLWSAALIAALTPAVSVAQTCLGLAPFSAGPVQIGASGEFGNDAQSFSGTITFGTPRGVFGGASVGTISYDQFEENTTVAGASLGWQVSPGGDRRWQVCPGTGVSFGFGPSTIGGSDVNLSSHGAFIGLQGGVQSGNRFRVVPTAGVALVYTKLDWDGYYFGAEDRTDVYGLISLGVGLVRSRLSLRPSVDIPVGLDNSDPNLGIIISVSVGRRS